MNADPFVLFALAFYAVCMAFAIAFFLSPAIMARSRGYSFFYWLFLSIAMSPILTLCVLAALPDRSLDERRAREGKLLGQLLAQKGHRAPQAIATPPVRSLGDATTLN